MTKGNRLKKVFLTKKVQEFRRRILTDDEIKAFAGHMREFMGVTFAALSDKYAISLEDTLRFQTVAARLAGTRTARGVTLKEAAASLKVPKYQLDYIENTSIRNISSKIALRYIEFLGLTRWFSKWKKANAELARRMGFTGNVTDVQKEKKKKGQGTLSGGQMADKKVLQFHRRLRGKKQTVAIAMKTNKWQNKDKEETSDKGKDKKGPAKPRKVAGKSQRYKLTETGVSEKGFRLGGEVHGVREGAGEYEPSEETPQKSKDSTRPIDSTRYLETAQGIKTYSEVSEILAVSVARAIEAVIDSSPEDIEITPIWICKIHNDIAGSLFPEWAGRFRDVNVQVGTHIPPQYFEVPVYIRLYCEDLAARLLTLIEQRDIEEISETLAYADWRFQWIHPFKDFNGRVGRILLTALLFKLKLPPAETASIEPKEKERYLRSLHEADAGDLSLLTEIWVERLS